MSKKKNKKSPNVKTSKRQHEPEPSDSLPVVVPTTGQKITSRGLQTVEVIRCPRRGCWSDQVSWNGNGVGVRYFKCRRCGQKFKAKLADPRKPGESGD